MQSVATEYPCDPSHRNILAIRRIGISMRSAACEDTHNPLHPTTPPLHARWLHARSPACKVVARTVACMQGGSRARAPSPVCGVTPRMWLCTVVATSASGRFLAVSDAATDIDPAANAAERRLRAWLHPLPAGASLSSFRA
eukprot:280710-Chlamydomonas_euryale.AAC.1